MLLKFAGLMCFLAAAGLAGCLKAEELKQRIRLLEELEEMILNLKSQMNYFREPLYSIFEKTGKTSGSRAFLLPAECLNHLRRKNGGIGEIWAQNAEEIYRGTPLTEEDIEIIKFIGTYLGQTDFENQKYQFECTEERLRRQIIQAEETYRQKGPMYRKIGFFGGSLAVLILL